MWIRNVTSVTLAVLLYAACATDGREPGDTTATDEAVRSVRPTATATATAAPTDAETSVVLPTELVRPTDPAAPDAYAESDKREQRAAAPDPATYPSQNVAQPAQASEVAAAPATPAEAPTAAPVITTSNVAAAIEREGGDAGATSEGAAAVPDHGPFNALLQRFVDASGNVDYAGFKAAHPKLKAYLKSLDSNPPEDAWRREDGLAYWINAYNAATLDLILDNYPLSSIKDLDGGNPWDVKRVRLGGQVYSLNGIENDVIRPRYGDARIHFAVNCAAASCPPLRNEAYTGDRLEEQLGEQTRAFLNDDGFTEVDGDAVTVSSIFDWYGEDFGDVARYIGKYRDDVDAGAEVSFSDYDWSLNAQ